jgi:haloalkane dehalogenase
MPMLIPISPDDEAAPALRRAWTVLETLKTPLLCAFGAEDHVNRGDHSPLSTRIPGAEGQPHVVIKNAGHFLQEDQPEELAAVIHDFVSLTR